MVYTVDNHFAKKGGVEREKGKEDKRQETRDMAGQNELNIWISPENPEWSLRTRCTYILYHEQPLFLLLLPFSRPHLILISIVRCLKLLFSFVGSPPTPLPACMCAPVIVRSVLGSRNMSIFSSCIWPQKFRRRISTGGCVVSQSVSRGS